MFKSNKCKSFKKHVFTGSLILLFLVILAIKSNVWANGCPDSEALEYSCTMIETCNGETADIEKPCARLCVHDDTASLYFGGFSCNLYYLDSKNLLGTGSPFTTDGCSVTFRGRSMTVDYMPYHLLNGCNYHLQCKKCDGCCNPV